jgi:hypothetical protein
MSAADTVGALGLCAFFVLCGWAVAGELSKWWRL